MGTPIHEISDNPEIQKILHEIDTDYGKKVGDGELSSHELDAKDDILNQEEMDRFREANGGETLVSRDYPDGVLDWEHAWRLIPWEEHGDYNDHCMLAAVEQALFRHGLVKEFRNKINLEETDAILTGSALCLEVAPQYFISTMIYLSSGDLDLQSQAIAKANSTYIGDFRHIYTEDLQLKAIERLNWHELAKGNLERTERWVNSFLEHAVSETVKQRFLKLAEINLNYCHEGICTENQEITANVPKRESEMAYPIP